jgi:hypothetical protein
MEPLVNRIEGHYEVKEVGFGKVHRWRSERRVIECECGERPILTSSMTACDGCGTDYTFVFAAELLIRPDEPPAPRRLVQEQDTE